MLLFLTVLMFNLVACGKKDTVMQSESTEQSDTEITQEISDDSDMAVNPELKAFLDEYEKFMDEYIDFMKNYNNSDNTAELISDYTSIMQQYAEFAGAIEEYDTDEMSEADAVYYLEVVNRVNEKIAKTIY